MDDVDAQDRDVAMVFQSHALYPNMSIYENIRFPLRMRGVPHTQQDAKVRGATKMVELGDFFGTRRGAAAADILDG